MSYGFSPVTKIGICYAEGRFHDEWIGFYISNLCLDLLDIV